MNLDDWPKHDELERLCVGDRIELTEEGKEETYMKDDKRGIIEKLTKDPDGIKHVHVKWDNYVNVRKHDPEYVKRLSWPCYYCGRLRYIEECAPTALDVKDIPKLAKPVREAIVEEKETPSFAWKCTSCAESVEEARHIRQY